MKTQVYDVGHIKVNVIDDLFDSEKERLLDDVFTIASELHDEVRQTYDKQPYHTHLKHVWYTARNFHQEADQDISFEINCAAILHDVLEDTRTTYNDLKNLLTRTGGFTTSEIETIVEITYALTEEKGRNRAERHNDKYYQGIKDTPGATFVKLCDRLSNMSYGASKGKNSMLEVYIKEHKEFKEHLYDGRYQPIWDEIEKIVKKYS